MFPSCRTLPPTGHPPCLPVRFLPSWPAPSLLSVLLLLPSLALADAASAPALPAPTPSGGLLQVVFSLLLVALLLGGTLYLLNRLNHQRAGNPALLRVISGATLGPRERIVIVEVADTWLVLGVTAGQITRLHELPRQTDATAPSAPSEPLAQNFAAWLKAVMERRHASGPH
ncbi:MAG: flagellar biosynthetic protein FliO [Sterolibacterium sp.]|nr:flagellar biosynthetic protein FliO [Sterolibacterium sp.]MBP9798720.1 flagellar biosynthetic protein FliO [Sterolibacterium sp.]